MKKTILFLGLLSMGLTFGQQNQSSLPVATAINNPIGQQFSGQEIFRFRSGLVTQLDAGNNFGFTNSQWFALGRVGGTPNGFNQNFYGLRFQQPNKALTMGYTSAVPNNPRIEWVGTGASLGDLEFRVGSGFGTPGVPGPNTLVATMTKDGNSAFGNNPLQFSSKVGIAPSFNHTGLSINGNSQGFSIITEGSFSPVGGSLNTIGGQDNFGLILKSGDSVNSNGVLSIVYNSDTAIGLRGFTEGQGSFNAAVYGESQNNGNHFAGFFDGDVTVNGNFNNPSDRKLKTNIKAEESVLEKLNQIETVTYNFIKSDKINLSEKLQHGFIAQNLESVFPELIKDVKKPVFDKEGKFKEFFEYKSVNYLGLISILTSSIKELQAKIATLEKQDQKIILSERLSKEAQEQLDSISFSMEQNIPNPFDQESVISYTIPKDARNSSIMIFDLNGKLLKEFSLSENKGSISIKASDFGKGMFLYAMVYNGNEILTKKMIIK